MTRRDQRLQAANPVLVLAVLVGTAVMLSAADPLPPVDVDHDGRPERLAFRDGEWRVERRDDSGAWGDADIPLPAGLPTRPPTSDHPDPGIRLLDLNGDGFVDLLFSDGQRHGIHLWTREVKPHLGWTRGWSQLVREGTSTGAAGEPPDLTGTEVSLIEGRLRVRRDGQDQDIPVASLLAYDHRPPLEPDAALASFRLRKGFRIDLVAAEPVVVDPVCMDWGPDGRLWVAEMRDYPLGMDGHGAPGGVLKVLRDADGDGRHESADVFLDNLPFPSSVMAWGRGVLVAAAPDVFYAEDSDGDGRADIRRVLLTGFAPGNQQHRINGFEWGLDGWIHLANGDSGGTVRSVTTGAELSIRGRDLRFRPDTGELEPLSAQTQYGRRRDDWGNWFGNNNPTWLWQVTLPDHYLRRNPRLAVPRVLRLLAEGGTSTQVHPASPPQVRPNQPWSLNHVTSACSPTPYRDDLFGPAFADSVFISEPVHNVIHREVLTPAGSALASGRAPDEQESEFLASTDNWFRPTTLRIGPDGALYVADMYRLILEHPEWISPEMLARVDIRAGTDRGRLYRISPADAPRRPVPRLDLLQGRDLVEALNSPSGWQRDRVHQRLLANPDPGTVPWVARLLEPRFAPAVRVQALAVLGGLGGLTAERIRLGLRDPHPGVRAEALRWSERLPDRPAGLFTEIAALADDPSGAVRLQAAFTLGAWPAGLAEPVLEQLALQAGADEELRWAVQSSLQPTSQLFALLSRGAGTAAAASRPPPPPVPTSADRAAVLATYRGVVAEGGTAPARGREHFLQHCAPCHRLRGEGQAVGPDLGMASGKPADWLLAAILDPNAAVESRYRTREVTLRSGETTSGLIVAETANNLVLRTGGGGDLPVLREDIESVGPAGPSLMPEGFESVLDRAAMGELLGWIRGR